MFLSLCSVLPVWMPCRLQCSAACDAMQAGNVLRFTARFNEVSAWVVSLIVTEKKLETRVKVEPSSASTHAPGLVLLPNATLHSLCVRCKTFSSLHEMPHARSDFLDRLARGIMHSSYGIGSVHSHTDEVCCSASLSCNKQHCTATESTTDSYCCFSLGCAYTRSDLGKAMRR